MCKEPFDWTWDNFEPTKEILQEMVYDISLKYHPDSPKERPTLLKKKEIDYKA